MTSFSRLIDVPTKRPLPGPVDASGTKTLKTLSEVSSKVDDIKPPKIGSRLADWGEDTVAPWLAKTSQADHLGGKALRGLGWIGKQHSRIPGYDWMEMQLSRGGGAAFGALGLDPRIGMLIGAIAMPDVTDFVPGIGSALSASSKTTRLAKLNKIAEGKYFKGIPKYDPKVLRGMGIAEPAVPLKMKDKLGTATKKGWKKKPLKTASEQIPEDIPRELTDLISKTPEERAGVMAKRATKRSNNPIEQGINEEWNRMLDARDELIDQEWIKYLDIVDRLDNWEIDQFTGQPIVKREGVKISRMIAKKKSESLAAYNKAVKEGKRGGQIKPFDLTYKKYGHLESERQRILREIRDIRTSPIEATVQEFINNIEQGYQRAAGGVPGSGKAAKELGWEQHHAWANIEGSTFTAMLDQVGRAHKLDAWRYIAKEYGTVPGYALTNMWNLPGKAGQTHKLLHSWMREMGFEYYWRDLAKARPNMSAAEQMQRIDQFFEDVYYPTVQYATLLAMKDPAVKSLKDINMNKELLRKSLESSSRKSLAKGAIRKGVKSVYEDPMGAAGRKGWWATPEQEAKLRRWLDES